jgi:lysozyme
MIAELTAQLTRDEGRERSAYQDHLGFWTIGVGRLIDTRKGGGLREDEIDYLLRNDINDRIDQLGRRIPWFLELDSARQGVLLNMSFQLGVDGLLAFKNTLARVRAGNFAGAASSMLQSLWATQTPARAQRLAKQMETGTWQ